MTREELKSAAVSMLDRAYVPYSHFPVGAALECADGTVYTGCNVENAAYPAGTCAERNAIFHAVAEGHTSFRRIVVAGKSQDFCVPCGMCRQVMRDWRSSASTEQERNRPLHWSSFCPTALVRTTSQISADQPAPVSLQKTGNHSCVPSCSLLYLK